MAVTSPGADEMYCSSCGVIIKRRAEICVHCGVRVAAPPSSAAPTAFSDKSRVAAGVLGILLGAWGVHSFYLGKIGKGVIQIIVTLITLGFGSLWGLIEGIIIITGGPCRDAQGRPLRKYNE